MKPPPPGMLKCEKSYTFTLMVSRRAFFPMTSNTHKYLLNFFDLIVFGPGSVHSDVNLN